MVPWLRLHDSTARDAGLIPGQGSFVLFCFVFFREVLHAAGCGQKQKQKQKFPENGREGLPASKCSSELSRVGKANMLQK